MEISTIIDYMAPLENAPQPELKARKAPDLEDAQRFESILKGEGPYQPKTLDLVIPATEPNAVQNVGNTILDNVTTLKTNVDSRLERINAKIDSFHTGDYTVGDALELQQELYMYSLETTAMSKSCDKAGEGLKTMFRAQ